MYVRGKGVYGAFPLMTEVTSIHAPKIMNDMDEKIKLSGHFSAWKLLLYSLPAIFNMMVITSFQLVDGYFVSNLMGILPFAAVNLISPPFFVLYAIGFMFGEGTSALVSQSLGEGDLKKGQEIFTMSLAIMVLLGIILGITGAVLMPQLARFVGATEATFGYCITYGRLLMLFLPFYLVNAAFQSLWITAEKAWIGTAVSVLNGAVNIFLDWFLMGVLKMGVAGAAIGTSGAAVLSAVVTLLIIFRSGEESLRFVRFPLRRLVSLFMICGNGFSEMVSSISGNVMTLLLNLRLIRFFGEPGVDAMGVYMFVIELYLTVFFGISSTAVTVVGYKYGERDRDEINSLLRSGMLLIAVFGVIMAGVSLASAEPVAALYVGYDPGTYGLAVHALRISALGVLFYGVDILTSAVFTGLGDGLSSAIISFAMSLAAPALFAWLLPALFGPGAIWFAVPAGIALTAGLCVLLLKKRYPGQLPEIGEEKTEDEEDQGDQKDQTV